ncbi:MAG: SIMPL domain-containing protein [Clostridiales bacterium]|nr:SIMPL domain-containing protein [Clostridiales bacterium]
MLFEKLEKFQLVLLSLILAFGLIIAVKCGANTLSNNNIIVTGSAYKIVKSDSARMEFEISERNATKQSAYNAVKKQLPIVKKYLMDKGITDIDVSASNGYYSYKYLPNGNVTNETAYYNLSQPIVIKSNDVQKIKEISSEIQSLLDQGIDINVTNTEYFYSGLSELKVDLLKEATKDAKDRATGMLKATHNRPGKIQSVNMGVFQITPVDSTNVSDMGINDTSSIDKKVTAVANVVFRIK